MVRLPLDGPAVVGVKTTLTVQVEAAGTLPAQVSVSEKGALAEMEFSGTAAAVAFESVTIWAALADPTFCENVKLVGDTAIGAIWIFARKTSEQGPSTHVPPP